MADPKDNLTGHNPDIKEARQKALLASLRKHGIIGRACRDAEVPRSTLTSWRESDEEFDNACKDAIADAADSLEEVADKRARGHEEVVIYKDQIVWARNADGSLKLDDDFEPIPLTKVSQSDNVLLAMLKAKKPEYREKSSVELSSPGGGPLPTAVVVKFVKSNGDGGKVEEDPLGDDESDEQPED